MPNLIEFGKNTASSEQELISQFDSFLTSKCNWTRIGIISDTSSDRDYVYYSRGTIVGKYRDLYVRLRGYNNYIYAYGYSYWESSTSYSGELHNTYDTRINAANSSLPWYGFGDADGFWLVVKDGSYYYSMYGGYIETYYGADVDNLPVAIVGQQSYSTWYTSSRTYMYASLDDLSTTYSGTGRPYITDFEIYNAMLAYSDPSARDGTEQGHCPIVLINSNSSYGEELRGELRHVLWFPGADLSSEDWYTVSGTNYKYFIKKYADNATEGFGPIDTASGTSW